jgi:low affinity Fe/Cu permease
VGTSPAFLIGLLFYLIWAISFYFKGQWHNSIVEFVGMLSFLNIFFVQRGQNKDLRAIHIKLDELIASSNIASNSLIKAEEAPEEVLQEVNNVYKELAKLAQEGEPRTAITSEVVEKLMEAVHNNLELKIIKNMTRRQNRGDNKNG